MRLRPGSVVRPPGTPGAKGEVGKNLYLWFRTKGGHEVRKMLKSRETKETRKARELDNG